MAPQNDGASGKETPARVRVIRDGLAAHLPDIDPEETSEWLDSFDEALARGGQQRARYLMLRILERARERNVAGRVLPRRRRLARFGAPPGDVVLVDDVVTTGATLAESVRVLRSAGVPVAAALVIAAA